MNFIKVIKDQEVFIMANYRMVNFVEKKRKDKSES